MSDKKKYEVTHKNCLSFKVGEIIELTDKKAKSLVNKIKPVVSAKSEKKAK